MHLVLIFSFLFSSQPILCAPQEGDSRSNTAGKLSQSFQIEHGMIPFSDINSHAFDEKKFEQAIEIWTEEMVDQFLKGESRPHLEVPNSFQKTTKNDRKRNQKFATWMYKNVPKLMEIHTTHPRTHSMNDVRMDVLEEMDRLEKRPFYRTGSLFHSVRESMENPHSFDRKLFGDHDPIGRDRDRYLQRVERDKARYGSQFFSDMTVVKGAVDVIGTGVHAIALDKAPANYDAMFAIGMLHPITDSVIDSGNYDKESFRKIARYLEGEKLRAATAFEQLVFDYVDDIYRAFPKQEAPFVHWLLPYLFKEQMRSATEKPSTKKEILRSAFLRGGLSSLAFLIPAHGKFDSFQTWSFYVGGGIYQLLDDFSDILADRKEGIPSIWLLNQKESGNFDKAFKAFLFLEKEFEQLSARYSSALEHESARYIHGRGFMNILVMSMILNSADPEIAKINHTMKDYLPLNIKVPQRLLSGIYNIGSETVPKGAKLSGDKGFNDWIEVGLFTLLNPQIKNEFQGLSLTEAASKILHSNNSKWGKFTRGLSHYYRKMISRAQGGLEYVGRVAEWNTHGHSARYYRQTGVIWTLIMGSYFIESNFETKGIAMATAIISMITYLTVSSFRVITDHKHNVRSERLNNRYNNKREQKRLESQDRSPIPRHWNGPEFRLAPPMSEAQKLCKRSLKN